MTQYGVDRSAAAGGSGSASGGNSPWRDVVYLTVANSPYTVTAAQSGTLFIVDASGGAVLINLPLIASIAAAVSYGFKKSDATGNAVTLDPNGTDTIDDGSATASIAVVDTGMIVMSDTDRSPDDWAVMNFGSASGTSFRDVVFLTSADSPYTVDEDDRGKLISCDCTSGAITINLPTISTLVLAESFVVGVKKSDTGGNAVTINRGGTDTIDGNTSKTLQAITAGTILVSDVSPSPDLWTSFDFGLNGSNFGIDSFSGTGSQTAFTLSANPGSENNTFVFIDGVYQFKSEYSVSGTTLTFTVAPPSGTNNIQVVIGTTLSIGTPADGTVTTTKLNFNPFRKNAIINGDFNVWQRGTSFAAIADGTYSADRWIYHKSGTMVHTVAQEASNKPTVAEAGRLVNYSILIDCTTADAAMAAGDYTLLVQKIEGYNWLPLAQRAFTLSFWVKATKTGTYCVAFKNSIGDRSYVAEYTINVADTWEKKTINVSASPSAGTWNYTNGVGLEVVFTIASGSTYNTTPGAWQTGNFHSTTNQVVGTDNVANNFFLALVQFEPGSTATDFEYRTYQDELALCQRYYQILGDNFSGVTLDATTWEIQEKFVQEMRTAPTVTTVSGVSAKARYVGTDITVASPTIANTASTFKGVWLQVSNDAGRTAEKVLTGRVQGNYFLQANAEL